MRTITLIVLIIALFGCAPARHRGAAIRDRLSETHGLATHHVSIDEETPGIIALNGNVSSDRDRETIEKVARGTSGVREVRNNLIVDPSFVDVREGYTSTSNDQRAIASEITSRISSSPELREYNINVGVKGSSVTLQGAVGSDRERSEAEHIARNTRGVSSVRNEIILARSARSDFQISQAVREALRRRTDIDLRNVDIVTRDAIVTLRGRQNSNRDIDNLVASTRAVAGVRDVQNELTLSDQGYTDRYRRR